MISGLSRPGMRHSVSTYEARCRRWLPIWEVFTFSLNQQFLILPRVHSRWCQNTKQHRGRSGLSVDRPVVQTFAPPAHPGFPFKETALALMEGISGRAKFSLWCLNKRGWRQSSLWDACLSAVTLVRGMFRDLICICTLWLPPFLLVSFISSQK